MPIGSFAPDSPSRMVPLRPAISRNGRFVVLPSFATNLDDQRSGFEVGIDGNTFVRDLTCGDFFDLVFDATGNTGAMEQSFGWVAHGGTLVLVGVVRTDIRFSDPDFHKRELTLKGSRNATIGDFREVLAAIRSGSIQVERLITHRGGLEEAPARFPEWIRPETGVVKAMIEL